MRRTDKEITDQSLLDQILKEEPICRIGLCDEGNPYVVPMIFSYHDRCLWLHSANEGRKIDILKKNNQVCFEVESKVEIVTADIACNWSLKYYSVIGFGKAFLVEDLKEKELVLHFIMQKYASQNSFEFSIPQLEKTIVIKVEISEITGKKSKY